MSLKITITGAPNTGKTTAARLIQLALEEAGYTAVTVTDAPPCRDKGAFEERWARNKAQPVEIVVEGATRACARCQGRGKDAQLQRCITCNGKGLVPV